MNLRWREWLTKRAHTWAAMALSLLTVGLVTGAALVGSTADAPEPPDDTSIVVDEPADEPSEDLADDSSDVAGAAGDGHAVENHGRCVSKAVEAAKEAGLEGSYKGAFVASIAEDESMVAPKDELGENCDFDDALTAALAEQEAAEGSQPPKLKPADEKEAKEHPGKGPKLDDGSEDGTTEEPAEDEKK